MESDGELLDQPLEINLKKLKLKKIFKKYRISILFGLIGSILTGSGLFASYSLNQPHNNLQIIPKEASDSAKEIIVDIEGAVFKPGVYRLKEGDRLQDVLIKAGGMSEEADREWVERNLNLAVKLIDGSKVYIPKISLGSSSFPASSLSPSSPVLESDQVAGVEIGKVNVNTASSVELVDLYGVGEKTAQKIIAGRPYAKIEELLEKKIVNKSVFETIKEGIVVY